MPITVSHAIDPLISGPAVYEAEAALAAQEEARRQDTRALQEREMQLAQERARMTDDLANARMAQDAYQFQQGMIDRDKQRKLQLLSDQNRLGAAQWQTMYGAASDRQMQGDRLAAGMWSDLTQQQNQRGIYADRAMLEMEKLRQEQMAKQVSGNYKAIMEAKQRGELDESQYQSAMDQVMDQYRTAGMAAPFAPPFESEDPELDQYKAQVAQYYPDAVIARDPKTGKPFSLIPPQYLPSFINKQQEHEAALADKNNADNYARIEQDIKKSEQEQAFKEQDFHRDNAQKNREFEFKQRELELKEREKANDLRIKGLEAAQAAEIKALEATIPKEETFQTQPDEEGNTTTDQAKYQQAMQSYQTKVQAIIDRYSPKLQALGEEADNAGGPPQWVLDLPSGAVFTAPDGTKRVKP